MIECESYKKPGGNSLVTTLNETAKFTLFVVGQKPISILMSNDNNTNCFHYRTCDFYKFCKFLLNFNVILQLILSSFISDLS